MRTWLLQVIFENWQRKAIALMMAVSIWFLVNSSITLTKTLIDVPVRVVNLPHDKTIPGLLPSGILTQRMTLTLTGNRNVLQDLEPGDLEVIIDASNKGDEWVAEIGKKNLVSLNPEIDLLQNIASVKHNQLLLKQSRLVTVKIPVRILNPQGEPPKGYQYLDVWPQQVLHTISGPEEQVEELQAKGLELTFDLSDISKEELDLLESSNNEQVGDEVSYFVPSKWKRVAIPFHNNAEEEINDPEAANLHIEFLRAELLPLNQLLPIQIFFPQKYSDQINPERYSLKMNSFVTKKEGIPFLTSTLFVRNVSRMFLDIVRDHIEVVAIASPISEKQFLAWSVQFLSTEDLENRYVSTLLPPTVTGAPARRLKAREYYLRNRFREYMRSFTLMKPNEQRFKLRVAIQGNEIEVIDDVATQ